MAGIQFTISLEGDGVTPALRSLSDSLSDMTPLMDSIGRALVGTTTERIGITNLAPDGTAWLQSHRAAEEGGPTLMLTHELRNSIVSEAGSDHVVVGSITPYAGVMHEGAERGAFGFAFGRTKPSKKRPRGQDYFTPLPWGDIPARPFLGISEADEEEITGLTTDFFASMVRDLSG